MTERGLYHDIRPTNHISIGDGLVRDVVTGVIKRVPVNPDHSEFMGEWGKAASWGTVKDRALETNRILNDHRSALNRLAYGHYTPDDMKRLKLQKPSAITMTVPRQSFRNWIEELPRWTPHALRASALITAILYGVAL